MANRHHISFPKLPYPVLRDKEPKTSQLWLKGKQLQDGAEGLWRIHDSLYDLTNFVKSHPGGEQWINFTKGTDITEAYETHHLSEEPDKLLPKFYVKKAATPRNSPFTFNDDGFYKTLKPKIIAKLKEIPPSIRKKSDYIMNGLIASLIILSPLSCWLCTKNAPLAIVAVVLNSFVLSFLTICAHNYLHRRDSWRMYLFNVGGMSYMECRVTHAMSHHLYTNTLQDLEITMLEPFLTFMPYKNKPLWAQMGAIYWPVIYLFTTLGLFVKDIADIIMDFGTKPFKWSVLITFLLPTWMLSFGGISIFGTLAIWLSTIMLSSLIFTVSGLTAGHHAHVNFFDGDIPQNEYLDWGLHQLDTVVDRIETVGNHFKSITTFGSHSLHHLFPTLDHGELTYLYPVVLDHCEKFDAKLRVNNFYDAVVSHSKQLVRKEPNDFRHK